jgi:Zn-dependent protease with chaperone function
MLEPVLVAVVMIAVAAPHLVALETVSPPTASAVWLSALALRALVSLGAAAFVLLYLPQTELFSAIAAWCWHAVVPVLAAHLGLSGHPLADAATTLPSLALAASLLWVVAGIARAALALRRHLRKAEHRAGPLGCTVVCDPGVMVAVPAVGRGRVLISEGALQLMDGEELAASVAHEFAHLRRRHRPMLVLGIVLAALARPLPGTRAAHRGLEFSLERDADEYAVRHTRDPLALASAICKVARCTAPSFAVSLGGRGRVAQRVAHLLGEGVRAGATREWASRLLAAAMAALVLAVSGGIVWGIAAPPGASAADEAARNCPH